MKTVDENKEEIDYNAFIETLKLIKTENTE